jgi:Tol biopolymer transport system component
MRLVRISLADGQRTPLTSPPSGSTGDIDGKFSPDGGSIAFRRGGQGDLYVVSAKGEQYQQATRLTFDMRGVRGIAWSDHGASILFGSQRGPTNAYGIWKIARSGGAPEPLTPGDFDAVGPAVAASGAIAVTHRQMVTELALHTLDGSKPERALVPPDQVDGSPIFSPDGRSVAFVSTRSGWEEVWLYREQGQALAQLTHFGAAGLVLYPSWSPDSRSIAFSRRENGATNIYTYSLSGDTGGSGVLKQITATRNRDISPVYSADGRYLYYSSNDDGTSRIWRIRADGTDHAEPLFWEAVVGFQPSPDGRWMYFVEGGPALVLVRRNLVDGSTEEVFRAPGSASFENGVAMANGQIYLGVSTGDASRSDIVRIDPATKRAKTVAHLNGLPPFEVAGFTISPDGRSLLATEVAHSESSFYSSPGQ